MRAFFLRPFLRLLRDGRLSALAAIGGDLKPFYRLAWLAAAAEAGLLHRLAAAPAPLQALAADCLAPAESAAESPAQSRAALEAWLQMGIRLKLLRLTPAGYALRGRARTLARPANDPALAWVEEVAGLHHKLLSGTLPKLRSGALFTLADQDGALIARSSRILEAFQAELIRRTFPARGPVRLLEIGCGSGVYLRHAAARNPSLTALGLELQPGVADLARANLLAWGLGDRVRIEQGDIRAQSPADPYDIATLYNNIYYFPPDERIALLRHIARFLRPDGFLLLTTCCQPGSLATEALNLWGAATRGAGPLPSEQELVAQLREAGYTSVKTTNCIPGDRFLAFEAFR